MVGQLPDPVPDPGSAGQPGADAALGPSSGSSSGLSAGSSSGGEPQGEPRLTWTDEAGEALAVESDVARALAAALRHGGEPDRHVDVIAVGAATLARMHGQFLGDPSETDVITFDLRDDEPEGIGTVDGEIYISADRAREVGVLRGHGPQREFVLYVVHGALHLCGFDDDEPEDRAAMREAEAAVMAMLGYPPDPSPHDL